MRWLFCLFLTSPAAWALHIVIDPGHGGEDHGARYNSIREADLALNVSLELSRILKAHTNIKTSLTRTDDSNLTLEQRVTIATEQKADLFLSIHANSSPNTKARGSEFYFQNQLPPNEEMQYLAYKENQIQKQQAEGIIDADKKADVLAIIDDLRKQSRIKKSYQLIKLLQQEWGKDMSHSNPIRQAPFYVLTQNQIPSVLIELGFLTNPTDAQKLNTKSFQKKLAQKIYQAVLKLEKDVDRPSLK